MSEVNPFTEEKNQRFELKFRDCFMLQILEGHLRQKPVPTVPQYNARQDAHMQILFTGDVRQNRLPVPAQEGQR